MKIQKILSFLTYPAKHRDEQPIIAGTEIPQAGRLYNMLADVFDRSGRECDIPICFIPTEDGKQENEVRTEVKDFLKNQSIPQGLKLAQRLQSTTTNKSGLGLLFLMIGESEPNKETAFLISRFPADEGIVASQNSETLTVDFVEQVFLKNSHSYKGVLYRESVNDNDCWTGNAIDKQMNHGTKEVATYWIQDFLKSDLATTSRAGTKRLALALKEAGSKTTDMSVKQEISAAGTLARNLSDRVTSISEFCDNFNLSEDTKKTIMASVKSERLANDKFQFDLGEFHKHFSYKSIELNNGAILTAPLEQFDQCFQKEKAEDCEGAYVYTTEGMIIDERLRKTK